MNQGRSLARAEPMLVEFHNHAHLVAVYGEDYARAVMSSLQWRVHLAGGSVALAGHNRFLAVLSAPAHAGLADGAAGVVSIAEYWQLQLGMVPYTHVDHCALPVVTVGPVKCGAGGYLEGGPYQPQELERIGGVAPCLPPVECGWPWRQQYESDMLAALAFLRALEHGKVGLAFQPVVRRAASRASMTHASGLLYQEALLRTELPELTVSVLVPALERLGLIRLLDRVVLDAVIDRLESEPALRVGCNLSSVSLVSDAWWDGPLERLSRQPAVAARLTIEITETAPLADFVAAKAFVRRLQSLGCQIAIDDFGDGHTRLDFVREIAPQVIKISGAVLASAARNGAAAEEFAHLAALGGLWAPYVVAEGVEREEDVAIALVGGANCLQGTKVARVAESRPPARVALPAVCREPA